MSTRYRVCMSYGRIPLSASSMSGMSALSARDPMTGSTSVEKQKFWKMRKRKSDQLLGMLEMRRAASNKA